MPTTNVFGHGRKTLERWSREKPLRRSFAALPRSLQEFSRSLVNGAVEDRGNLAHFVSEFSELFRED